MNISIYSSNSQFAQKKLVTTKSDVIHNDLVDIILADKAPGAVTAIILSEGVLDIACVGVRKVGGDVAFTCDKVVTMNAINKY